MREPFEDKPSEDDTEDFDHICSGINPQIFDFYPFAASFVVVEKEVVGKLGQ